ncbi:amidase [Sphingopyxis sp. BSNA05]|uniref:amidase family protein n=1 Tax=Sphingopyxis sp. BSNA05 TaxID=1236614 RepID=UPI0015652AE9|nr:amidase family protein [Sphingopyxis sp. BSNA05]NRD89600.1 amidase [Sphingopyxis sp. BSNA05]
MAIATLTTEATATGIASDIVAGKLSARDATEAAIARIEALDGPINAVVVRDFDAARAAANRLDDEGPQAGQPLFGVPMTVKESFNLAGHPSTWGLEHARNNIAQSDAVVVQRLKRAGAVIVGKTNVPPDLADWQSNNPVYGRTNNPHDLDRTPGGSSGAAAAAVSAGMLPCEFGSDIGGSIRVPAHYCGIWGHKPTFDVISLEGHGYPGTDSARPALSVCGPLARSAEDLATLLEVTLDHPLQRRDVAIKGGRFLLIDEQPMVGCSRGYRAELDRVAGQIEDAGGQVERRSEWIPDLEASHDSYLKMLNIAMAGGLPAPDGTQATVRDWFDLCDIQARVYRQWRDLFGAFDFVLAPVSATPAFRHHNGQIFQGNIEIDGENLPASPQLAWAGLVTFPGLPATVLPIGTVDGLPVGMQVIGDRFQDYQTIDGARQIGALLAT